jgi:hypothetical protein
MSGLNNISVYARGRNIDAIVDEQVSGRPAQSSEAKQEAAVAASPAAPAGKSMNVRIGDAINGAGKAMGEAAGSARDAVKSIDTSKWPTPRDLIEGVKNLTSDAGTLQPGDKLASLDSAGLSTVREGLGTDAAKVSDSDLRQALGSDVIAQIGKEGFPHEEVAGIQKKFGDLGLDKVAALQTFVEACSSKPGEQIAFCDQKGETVASLSSDKVLEAAGLDRSAIDQARDGGQQHREETKVAAAAQAEAAMSMG